MSKNCLQDLSNCHRPIDLPLWTMNVARTSLCASESKSGWLGVDDRVGVTTSDLDWKMFQKTDAIDKYPAATLIVPTCHIEGNGTAWFDDLEVITYDREKLPENFDAKHGRNNRMK